MLFVDGVGRFILRAVGGLTAFSLICCGMPRAEAQTAAPKREISMPSTDLKPTDLKPTALKPTALKPTAPIPAAAESARSEAKSDKKPAVKTKVILFIGDSLTEGYGVQKGEAFPERVEAILRSKGHDIRVINGGISGSVSAEADRRVRWYLKSQPAILVLALGANDGFKGTPPKVIKEHLERAIDLAQKHEIKVLLAGIRVFTNLGSDYTKQFEQVYRDLAKEKKVPLIPFLLEGVALNRELNQADLKHPNAKGHEVIARLVVRELEKML